MGKLGKKKVIVGLSSEHFPRLSEYLLACMATNRNVDSVRTGERRMLINISASHDYEGFFASRTREHDDCNTALRYRFTRVSQLESIIT